MKLTIEGEVLPLSKEDEICGNRLLVLGCVFCLCTVGLSWVPMCCWCLNMKKKYLGEASATQNNEEVPHQNNHGDNNDFHQNNNNHPTYGVDNPTYNNGPVYGAGNTYNNGPVQRR